MVHLLLTYQGPHPLENSLLQVATLFFLLEILTRIFKDPFGEYSEVDPYSGGYEPTASAQVRFQLLSTDLIIINFYLQWSAPPPGYGGEGESGGYPGERYGRRRDSREDRCASFNFCIMI